MWRSSQLVEGGPFTGPFPGIDLWQKSISAVWTLSHSWKSLKIRISFQHRCQRARHEDETLPKWNELNSFHETAGFVFGAEKRSKRVMDTETSTSLAFWTPGRILLSGNNICTRTHAHTHSPPTALGCIGCQATRWCPRKSSKAVKHGVGWGFNTFTIDRRWWFHSNRFFFFHVSTSLLWLQSHVPHTNEEAFPRPVRVIWAYVCVWCTQVLLLVVLILYFVYY